MSSLLQPLLLHKQITATDTDPTAALNGFTDMSATIQAEAFDTAGYPLVQIRAFGNVFDDSQIDFTTYGWANEGKGQVLGFAVAEFGSATLGCKGTRSPVIIDRDKYPAYSDVTLYEASTWVDFDAASEPWPISAFSLAETPAKIYLPTMGMQKLWCCVTDITGVSYSLLAFQRLNTAAGLNDYKLSS